MIGRNGRQGLTQQEMDIAHAIAQSVFDTVKELFSKHLNDRQKLVAAKYLLKLVRSLVESLESEV